MTETEKQSRPDTPANDESPFATPAIEGMPYARGSDEDAAVNRILEKSEPER